jgi:hypothetical protein
MCCTVKTNLIKTTGRRLSLIGPGPGFASTYLAGLNNAADILLLLLCQKVGQQGAFATVIQHPAPAHCLLLLQQ